MNKSFEAGVNAAKTNISIDNSYPHNHEDFVKGYRSIKPDSKENLDLKTLSMNLAPEEYPYLEVPGQLSTDQIYLVRQTGTFYNTTNLNDRDLEILNMMLLVKVELKKI